MIKYRLFSLKSIIFLFFFTVPFLFVPVRAVNAFVVDHTNVSQFSSLTTTQLDTARNLRLLFEHRSTGERIHLNGLNCLTGTTQNPLCSVPSPSNKYNYPNWTWRIFDAATAPDKINSFSGDVVSSISSYDVFAMKFCYLDWWEQDFATYRDMMLGFENSYPTKKFIWVTQALMLDWNNSPGPGSIKTFNEQLRQYAKANNKPLYDVADIESHNSSGTACTQTLGGVTYESLCSVWWEDDLGHPNVAGSTRLAQGFWLLMANLNTTAVPTITPGGPSPTATRTPTPTPTRTPTPTITPTATLTPVPPTPTPTIHCSPLGDVNCDGLVNVADLILQASAYGQNNIASDLDNSGKVNMIDTVILLKNFGISVPSSTPTNTPTPTATVTNQTIDFGTYSGTEAMSGEYPTGVINWGSGSWSYDSGTWGGCSRSVWFTGSNGITSNIFTFVSPHKLVSLTACNGGSASSTITASCSGNAIASMTVPAGSSQILSTNWTSACSAVTVTSSNGNDTNFDNIVYQ